MRSIVGGEHRDRRVCVIGGGYVGLVTAASLASAERTVTLVERDPARLASLERRRAPFAEPGLDERLISAVREEHLRVTSDLAEGVRGAGMVVIAVGTPNGEKGGADLAQVEAAITATSEIAEDGTVAVIKSSVPPGTTRAMETRLHRRRPSLAVVTCPEFLREGHALEDFDHPARIVVGGTDQRACERVVALFSHLGAPVIITDSTSAEIIKYGSNAFLALKISFINEIAHLSELAGADADVVAKGIGADPRIGPDFLRAGLGFGGSCLPKDVQALVRWAEEGGYTPAVLGASASSNAQQGVRFLSKIAGALGGDLAGCHLAVLGMAFKPGTDDLRDSPAIQLIRRLQASGATVVATDPAVRLNARDQLLTGIVAVDDPYRCVEGADAVVLATEWPDYPRLDWSRVATLVRRRIVVDGRSCLDGAALGRLGFTYARIGAATVAPARVAPLAFPNSVSEIA